MTIPSGGRRRQKSHQPQSETGQEAVYLRTLSERQTPVAVQLRDGETLHGWIEYFDDRMIRLTRDGQPNLFIYKRQIVTITEKARRPAPRKDKAAAGDEPV
jgi:host factor-I protein